jgi:putative membrane protein
MNIFSYLTFTAVLACVTHGFGLDSPCISNVDKVDQTFVDQATQCGLFEVRSFELALKRGISKPEHIFARQMTIDHGNVSKTLATFAYENGIFVATVPNQMYQDLLNQLGAAIDSEFTEKYVSMQLKVNKLAVDLFTDESINGRNGDLCDFASKTLPTLKENIPLFTALCECQLSDKK